MLSFMQASGNFNLSLLVLSRREGKEKQAGWILVEMIVREAKMIVERSHLHKGTGPPNKVIFIPHVCKEFQHSQYNAFPPAIHVRAQSPPASPSQQ